MTKSPSYDALISQLEKALLMASELESKLLVELLRMAFLAAHEEAAASRKQ